MNKKQMMVIGIAVAIVLAAVLVVAITSSRDAEDDRLQVVATFYSLAYFAEEIGGEHVNVRTLIPPGQEVHTWHPSTGDILAADKADVLIYNGAGLEPWFEDDIMGAITKEGKEIVDTTHDLELFEYEESEKEHLLHSIDHIIHEWEEGEITAEEAMEEIEELVHIYLEHHHEEEKDYGHNHECVIEDIDHVIHEWEDGNITAEEALEALEALIHEYEEEHAHSDHDHGLYDPHTWTDPVLAKQQALAIYNTFKRADPDNADYYTARWNSLSARFDSIHTEYSNRLSILEGKTIFVTHDAYGYLARRYGFEQHTIIGIHADEEPGVTTLANIADKMVEYEVYTFFVQPLYPDRYAETIKTEVQHMTGNPVAILPLYHMSNYVEGLDYFQQLEANLENLKIGLGA